MAKTKSADDAGEGAPQATVGQDMPDIEVEILDGVEGFIEGEPIEPGKRYFVNAALAMNLVQQSHAKITGSR